MNGDSWFFVIVLGLTSVLLFAFLYAAVRETGYVLNFIPSKYIYYLAAALVAILSFILYIVIFYTNTGDHTGMQLNSYYIITLAGIFAFSWVFFDLNPTVWQFVGMAIILGGLIIFTSM